MKTHDHPGREMLHPDSEAVVQGNNEFALDLYRNLKGAEGNLFLSPYSISTALAMTYAGARGDTEAQMGQTLHFTIDGERLHAAFASLQAELDAAQEGGQVLLRVANTLWPQDGYPFLETFLALTRQYYGVSVTPVNYVTDTEGARQRINTWAEEKTEHKIKDLIGPGILNSLTRLVLTNAIYFKGNWASQFDETLTEDAAFWVTPSEAVEVPMMTQKREFKYAQHNSIQILELPYVGDDLSMIVLLPTQVGGLAELEEALTPETLEKWTSHVREQEVIVFLPRFKMKSSFRLDATLMSMGMRDAFNGRADFSGMDGGKGGLYIAAVIHKAFVDVNEEGTEAAAATAVVMELRGLPLPPPTFRADHPFIFLIRENRTGSILFLGRVVNPMAKAAD
jgi:serine protease inhibitor